MKVALVHDYLRDFGGAERVLRVLSDMFPEAPIYTSFFVPGSPGYKAFEDKKVIESKFGILIKYFNLYSPLRFLLPWIWKSIDLRNFDLVITSSSNYIARGFKVGKNTKVICYCHTPPRFLYGYKTGDLQKIWPVKVYASIISFFIRKFDWNSAQKINYWIANSENVKDRIEKIYKKDSTVIYPPVNVKEIMKASKGVEKENYFLIVSRLVGTKGLAESINSSVKLGFNLKIVGSAVGLLDITEKLKRIGNEKVEFLGRVSDKELWTLYAKAKGFIALAKDEDFGMTVVESEAAGTPVIAFNGGGFKESVIDGKTGILINDLSESSIKNAVEKFEKIKWNKKVIQENAKRFSKASFEKQIKSFVNSIV